MKIKIINEESYGYGYVGYPDDIARWDNDPRSPRYIGPDYELTEYDDYIEADVEYICRTDDDGWVRDISIKFSQYGRKFGDTVDTDEYRITLDIYEIEDAVGQALIDKVDYIWGQKDKKFKITATVNVPVILSTYYDIRDFGNHSKDDDVVIDGDIEIENLKITEVEE